MEDIGSENEEGVGYIENKRKHNEHLSSHPFEAKKLL